MTKVAGMPHSDGPTLRAWRRARGWDGPEMARQLRGAGRELRQASDIRKTAHVLGPIRALLKPFQKWDAFTLIELQSSKFARPFKLY